MVGSRHLGWVYRREGGWRQTGEVVEVLCKRGAKIPSIGQGPMGDAGDWGLGNGEVTDWIRIRLEKNIYKYKCIRFAPYPLVHVRPPCRAHPRRSCHSFRGLCSLCAVCCLLTPKSPIHFLMTALSQTLHSCRPPLSRPCASRKRSFMPLFLKQGKPQSIATSEELSSAHY